LKLDFSFWTNASQKRKRIISIIAIFVIAFLVTVIGSYFPLSSSDAQAISQNLNNTLNQNRANNTLTQYIFLNNFAICLAMFIPVFGAALGMFILFETGIALGAITTIQGFPVWVGLASLVITPVFWIEFISYSIAMAESIWLFRKLIKAITSKEPGQGRLIFWRELKWLVIFIGTCAGLLAAGALVEGWLITVLG
jgi:uncharacterized membrane protein SpoIIM required for sporulation